MGCVMIFCSLDAILTDWRCTDACVVRVWSAASGVATDFYLARAPHDRWLTEATRMDLGISKAW